jgi:L-amino acid N-acyltransferase YncA
MLIIREATDHDRDAVWEIFHAVVAGGDTYVFDPETPRDEALAYWFANGTRTYVAESGGGVVGTYVLRPNRPGLGSHVANASFRRTKENNWSTH